MKTIMFITILFNVLLAPFSQKEITAKSLYFAQNTLQYGTIKKGSDPMRKFSFTNKGDKAIFILDAKGSCGCTVPTFPKQAIQQGETNYLTVNYDTQRVGKFQKTISVQISDGTTEILTINGEVVE
jgi:hypothetical protein